MVVPKIAMKYLAGTVGIIKMGDRQLKFVKIKNNIAAVKAPDILKIVDLTKYCAIKPIKIILPQVNNIVL